MGVAEVCQRGRAGLPNLAGGGVKSCRFLPREGAESAESCRERGRNLPILAGKPGESADFCQRGGVSLPKFAGGEMSSVALAQ